MPVVEGKPNVMAQKCPTISVPSVRRAGSLAPMCTSIHHLFLTVCTFLSSIQLAKLPSPEGLQKRKLDEYTSAHERVLIHSCRYISALEDRLESLEGLLKRVSNVIVAWTAL